MSKTHVYIGGGAAGFFAAINCAEKNPTAHHILLEATHRPMTKIKVSGGGRCNVTHNCFEPSLLIANYPRGAKELRGAFHRFQPRDTIEWFAKRGVTLKAEADGRMFPITDDSETILSCLYNEASRLQIDIRKGARVQSIRKDEDGSFVIELHKGDALRADTIMLSTGSVPLGWELAASLGHTIIDPVPSLFTFNCEHPLLQDLMGTSFARATLNLSIPSMTKPRTWVQSGPLLITHWGLSGPAVLKLSAFAAKELHDAAYQAKLSIHWVAKYSRDEIFDQLSAMKEQHPQQTLAKSSLFELSKRFFAQLIAFALPERSSTTTWGELSKVELRALTQTLCQSSIEVRGKGVFKEEFVSCGGVDLKEVDFKTMESKICPGLYFAGEILNIDGITGGFNFQAAWTCAWIAAQAMSAAVGHENLV